ncbi:MAG: PQQ-dependent sugar dehydrogenase [Bacteriovoracaceae bacterium]|nr:PQQ-dependent sugar dehydrogenase [Bacteriovoracaceae bacterium]
MSSDLKRLVILLILLTIAPTARSEEAPFLPQAPEGFKVSLYGAAVNARQMTLSDSGNLYVGSMEGGAIHLIKNGQSTVVMKDLNYPSGVLWHQGDLFIAEISRISVIRNIDQVMSKKEKVKMITLKEGLPKDTHHGWKYLAIGPDQKLYFPIGAPCNICLPDSPYGTLNRMSLDGKNFETLATGIRNTTGFDFNPQTKELWFTEHGRDMMGDNLPPDEINILKAGAHYGFPFEHASKVKDPHFYHQKPKGLVSVYPVGEIQAHSAPVGIRFITGAMAKKYPGCFFVSLHGSWNRSKKVGYAVEIGCLDKEKKVGPLKPFLTGFLKEPVVYGRPADLLFLKDGSLLVSDDHGGKIWKVEMIK